MSTTARVFPYNDAPAGLSSRSSIIKEMSPTTKARWAAVLLLATVVGGVVAQGLIADKLIVTGNAAATARNILANQTLIRAAFDLHDRDAVSDGEHSIHV